MVAHGGMLSITDVTGLCTPSWVSRTLDTDGEVQQPSAYSDDDSCKVIYDERNGARNVANSATVAVPTTSPSVSLSMTRNGGFHEAGPGKTVGAPLHRPLWPFDAVSAL